MNNLPKCHTKPYKCKALVGDNRCNALSETWFGDGIPCPFYKTNLIYYEEIRKLKKAGKLIYED